jgi:DNA polymerase-1
MIPAKAWLDDHADVVYITTQSALLAALTQLKRAPKLGLDIETSKIGDHEFSGLNPKRSKIRLVQLYDGVTCFVVNAEQVGLDWLEMLRGKPMTAHNAQFEDAHLYYAGIQLAELHCSMLMARVFLGTDNLSLAALSGRLLNVEVPKELQVSDWSATTLTPEQIDYAALDAVLTYQLHEGFEQHFKEEPYTRFTYDFLQALIRPATRQFLQGIRVDEVALSQVIADWKQEQAKQLEALASLRLMVFPSDKKEQQTLREAGFRSLSSSTDKQSVLREMLTEGELAEWPSTAKGALKTGSKELATLEHHPALQALGAYSAVTSRLANYGDVPNKEGRCFTGRIIDGKLYPQYRIAGMITGRFQCNKPNIQNQPREGFKHIYLPPEGCVFVGADLSQVELRVAGLISGDEVINQSYAKNSDLHMAMAEDMLTHLTPDHYQAALLKFNGDEKALKKHYRTGAKGVNFGLLFGGAARGLQAYCKTAYNFELTLAEAEGYKALFHSKYATFTHWQQAIVKHSTHHNSVESQHSRLTRYFVEADYLYPGKLCREPYNSCMNHPVQSSAWEILALAIVYIDKWAPAGVAISHHVYDELILSCPPERIEKTAQLLYDGFAHGYQMVFPGCPVNAICEVRTGPNWGGMRMAVPIIERVG